MAAFLAGKLVREKNGRFERHGWEKEVEICGKEGKLRQLGESFEIVDCGKTSFLSRTWRNILNQGETSTGAMVFSS